MKTGEGVNRVRKRFELAKIAAKERGYPGGNRRGVSPALEGHVG